MLYPTHSFIRIYLRDAVEFRLLQTDSCIILDLGIDGSSSVLGGSERDTFYYSSFRSCEREDTRARNGIKRNPVTHSLSHRRKSLLLRFSEM